MEWVTSTLSDISVIQSGSGFPKKYQGLTDEEYPFYKVSDMNLLGNEESLYFENNTISSKTRSTLKTSLFPVGSIIFPKVGAAIATNKKRILTKIGCVDNNVMGVIPNESKIDSRFLYYWFQQQNLSEFANEAALPSIKKTTVEKWPVSYPDSILEQKRIVSILDTVFADLEQARAKTEQNLKYARELFDSYLEQVFSQSGEGWVEIALGEISQVSYGYTEKASFDRNGPHFLRITDIQDGEVDWSKVPFCTISEANHEKYRLLSGDIVFARTGATTGKSYLLTSPPDSVAASYLIRLRLHSNSLSPKFVKFFFQTKEYWDVVNAGMSGSAQGGFNASKLSAIKIKYPECKNKQDKLILQMTEIHHYVEQVNAIYKQKLNLIGELKKSILQKAFSGELTAKAE